MTDAKDNSSLPLLMSITGAVVVVAVGGWFFLAQKEPQQEREYQPPAGIIAADVAPTAASQSTPANTAPISATEGTRTAASGAALRASDDAPVATPDAAPASGVDVELRKARLAADAELLIYPAEQSAFHYYSEVLRQEPYHAVASAELDTVLAKVALTVNQHLGAGEFSAAYAISEIVATLRPEHELVINTQRLLDKMTEDLVAQATESARSGKDTKAGKLLDEAAKLPGRSAEYFAAVRESIAEIREVRLAAERDRANRARLAASEARTAWIAGVRNAIAAGNLVAPAGTSAYDLLADGGRWTSDRAELEVELLNAIEEVAGKSIDNYDFEMAELLVAARENFPDEQARFDELQAALEEAYIAYESSQVKKVSDLVAVKLVQPRYPRAAKMRSTTGWVEILFTVAPDGSTEQIEINRSEPEDVFDDAAVQAVDNWRFEPVEYRGQLISQRAGARLVFSVE